MRTVLATVLALLTIAPAWASLTLVQNARGTTTGATCTISGLSAIGARDLLVVSDDMQSAAKTSNSASDGTNTYTHCSNCHATDATAGVGVDMWYVLSAAATAGSTTVTVTRGGSVGGFCYFAEYSFGGTSVAVDASGSGDDAVATLTQAGVSLTLTGTNDAVVQIIESGNNASKVSSISPGGSASFTNPFINFPGDRAGFAGAINTTDGSAPTWTLSGSARAVVAAMAFKESGGASKVRHRVDMY